MKCGQASGQKRREGAKVEATKPDLNFTRYFTPNDANL
jgi:hypothetical protein